MNSHKHTTFLQGTLKISTQQKETDSASSTKRSYSLGKRKTSSPKVPIEAKNVNASQLCVSKDSSVIFDVSTEDYQQQSTSKKRVGQSVTGIKLRNLCVVEINGSRKTKRCLRCDFHVEGALGDQRINDTMKAHLYKHMKKTIQCFYCNYRSYPWWVVFTRCRSLLTEGCGFLHVCERERERDRLCVCVFMGLLSLMF